MGGSSNNTKDGSALGSVVNKVVPGSANQLTRLANSGSCHSELAFSVIPNYSPYTPQMFSYDKSRQQK